MVVKHKCLLEISTFCIRWFFVVVVIFNVSFFLKTERACCDNLRTSSIEAANNTLHDKISTLQSTEMIAMEKMYNEMRILFSLRYEYFFEMIALYRVINLVEHGWWGRIYFINAIHCALCTRNINTLNIKRDVIFHWTSNCDLFHWHWMDPSSKIRYFIVWGIN